MFFNDNVYLTNIVCIICSKEVGFSKIDIKAINYLMKDTGFSSAIRTLTILPTLGKEGGDFAKALPWFPVVGLLMGIILYVIAYCGMFFPSSIWPIGIALIMVIIDVIQ